MDNIKDAVAKWLYKSGLAQTYGIEWEHTPSSTKEALYRLAESLLTRLDSLGVVLKVEGETKPLIKKDARG